MSKTFKISFRGLQKQVEDALAVFEEWVSEKPSDFVGEVGLSHYEDSFATVFAVEGPSSRLLSSWLKGVTVRFWTSPTKSLPF